MTAALELITDDTDDVLSTGFDDDDDEMSVVLLFLSNGLIRSDGLDVFVALNVL